MKVEATRQLPARHGTAEKNDRKRPKNSLTLFFETVYYTIYLTATVAV